MGFISGVMAPFKSAYRYLFARYDAVQHNPVADRYYENSDRKSGRASASIPVRGTFRQRSRYEWENNGWYSGMLRTAASHIVGSGPTLQIACGDPEACRRVENAWFQWCEENDFAGELRLLVETDWRDGETVILRTYNESFDGVSLSIRCYEADQLANPALYPYDRYVDDGIRLSPITGKPVEYYLLDHHPGDDQYVNPLAGEWYPANRVIHSYRKERFGGVRGLPRFASTLYLFPYLRRFKLATLQAAENAARYGVILKTTVAQVSPAQAPADFANVELPDSGMTVVPEGWDLSQLKPEHPASTEEGFIRSTLMEICRTACMPLHVALGTSKDSNFSSANMDFRLTWQAEVDTERDRITRRVVKQVFLWWLEEAAMETGLLDGLPTIRDIVLHSTFHWPPLPTADELDVITAATARMTVGQSSPSEEAARRGKDFEEICKRGAADLGIAEADYKARVIAQLFPATAGASPAPATPANAQPAMADPAAFADTSRLQFTRHEKAIDSITERFKNGDRSRITSFVLLKNIGMSRDDANELLDGVEATKGAAV